MHILLCKSITACTWGEIKQLHQKFIQQNYPTVVLVTFKNWRTKVECSFTGKKPSNHSNSTNSIAPLNGLHLNCLNPLSLPTCHWVVSKQQEIHDAKSLNQNFFISYPTDINNLTEKAEYPGGGTEEEGGRKRQGAGSQKSILGEGEEPEDCSKPEDYATWTEHQTNPDKNHRAC